MKIQPLKLQTWTAATERDLRYRDSEGAPKGDVVGTIVQCLVTPYFDAFFDPGVGSTLPYGRGTTDISFAGTIRL